VIARATALPLPWGFDTLVGRRGTPLMEAPARANPVSYEIEGLWSLVIEDWDLDKLGACFGVIIVLGAVLTGLSLRAIATYDR
jgi:hypothetical protein